MFPVFVEFSHGLFRGNDSGLSGRGHKPADVDFDSHARRGVPETGQPKIWKILGNPWKAPKNRNSTNQAEKYINVFNGASSRPPNFRKFIFGRIGGNQRVTGEKIWILEFLPFDGARA